MADSAPADPALTVEQLEKEARNLRSYAEAYLAIEAEEFTDEEREKYGKLITRATVRAGRHFASVFARGAAVLARCAAAVEHRARLRGAAIQMADFLDGAERIGSKIDIPEGTRCISISDSLAKRLSHDLRAAAQLDELDD